MISVVIPVYNKAASLPRAVESVLRQDVPTEIVVVDDGSEDAPSQALSSFGNAVTYIRQRNQGPSAARNRGARATRLPLLLFLDADDELLPGCLAAHVRCRDANPAARVTVSLTLSLEETIRRRPKEFTRNGEYHYSRRYLNDVVTGIPSCGICVDRDLYIAIGGFDEELRCWEITDFMSRLLAAWPIFGFLEKGYVTIHRDTGVSQFQQLQDDPALRALVVIKSLDHLYALGRDERALAIRRTREAARSLFLSGATREGWRVLNKIRVTSGWRHVIGPTYALGLLPRSLVAALLRTYRALPRPHSAPSELAHPPVRR